jgi:hypothetical protein
MKLGLSSCFASAILGPRAVGRLLVCSGLCSRPSCRTRDDQIISIIEPHTLQTSLRTAGAVIPVSTYGIVHKRPFVITAYRKRAGSRSCRGGTGPIRSSTAASTSLVPGRASMMISPGVPSRSSGLYHSRI